MLPSGRSVAVGLGLVALAVGTYALARSTSAFAVEEIRVEGTTPAVARQVRAALEHDVGTSLLALDRDLVARLEALPDVRTAVYDRAFPHTLVVRVEREVPGGGAPPWPRVVAPLGARPGPPLPAPRTASAASASLGRGRAPARARPAAPAAGGRAVDAGRPGASVRLPGRRPQRRGEERRRAPRPRGRARGPARRAARRPAQARGHGGDPALAGRGVPRAARTTSTSAFPSDPSPVSTLKSEVKVEAYSARHRATVR